jgi:hypothetical protein
LLEPLDQHRVLLRDDAGTSSASTFVFEASHRDGALDTDWDPVQRTEVFFSAYFVFGDLRLTKSSLSTQLDEGVQLRIELLNAVQMGVDDLDWREFARADKLRYLC